MGSFESTIWVRHIGDARFSIVTRGHEIRVDQPPESGGEDTGPTPTELFVASLASCVAYYGRMFLDARSLPDEVNIEARWSMERGAARVGKIEIAIDAPGLPGNRLDAFRRAVEHCTVHNSVAMPPAVSFEIMSGAKPAAQAS